MNTVILLFIVVTIILVSVHNWFLPGYFAGYDSLFYFPESYALYSLYPYAWSTFREAGLGGTFIPLLWGYAINGFTIGFLGKQSGLDWSIIDKFTFYFPFLLLSFFSAWYLAYKTLVNKTFAWISSLIYTVNTYILMVMSGGQVHFGLAYAIAPLLLFKCISIIDDTSSSLRLNKLRVKALLYASIIAGFILTLQIMFDLRVSYIVLIATLLYFILNVPFFQFRQRIKHTIIVVSFTYIIPSIVCLLLLAYWVLPTILGGGNTIEQLGIEYVNQREAVKFFSFARFENTIALMHPNWPENIFGKVGFMKPEFLILPILAYASLIFMKNERIKRRYLLYFVVLGLFGAFLAKGANEPFGELYIWLFENIPGFNAFRDPTKWYIIIALSYSVLIPFTIEQIFVKLTKHSNKGRKL